MKKAVLIANAVALASTSAQAQFFTHDDVVQAEHRTQQAVTRLALSGAAIVLFVAAWCFGQVVQRRRRLPASAVPEAFSPPPSLGAARIFRACGVGIALIGLSVGILYIYGCATEPKSPDVGPPFLIILGLLWIQQYLMRQSARWKTPLAAEVLASDQRPPVLFLRGFAEEEFELRKDKLWFVPHDVWTFEDAVLDTLKRDGPVIGLTNPMLRGRPSAYAPLDVSSAEWQQKVAGLIRSAGKVVVVVTSSEGLRWEVAQLRQNRMVDHTLFLFPPLQASESEQRLGWLESELGIVPDKLKIAYCVKSEISQPIALRLTQDVPQVYLGPPNLDGYLQVLDACR